MKAKNLIVGVLMFVTALVALPLFAQTSQPTTSQPVPASLPISSIDELTVYAMRLARIGKVAVNAYPSAFAADKGQQIEVEIQGNSAKEILTGISQRSFNLLLIRTNDWVSGYIQLYSRDGLSGDSFVLFYGGRQFRPLWNGQWFVMPADARNVELFLVPEIPLQLPGVQAAKIVERDERGTVIDEYRINAVNQERGYFFFPVYYAGKNGELVATLVNNRQITTAIFDLKTGQSRQPITPQGVSFQPTISGVMYLTDATNIVVRGEDGIKPVLVLTLTKEFPLLVLRAEGILPNGEIEYPRKGFWTVDNGNADNNVYWFGLGSGHLEMRGLPGTYYFWFEWNRFGTNRNQKPFQGKG